MQTQLDCQHTTLVDGLHFFRFMQPTHRAIDEWAHFLDVVHGQTPANTAVRYVMEYRLRGLPPVAYGAQTARNWLLAHPDARFTYIAFLHQSSVIMTLVSNVMRLLPGKERFMVRFFTDEQAALDWLRSVPNR
jgi:hypothetical protein